MKVSVVIPCFNSANLIRTLDSVVNQTLPPHEILLVDDCSSDIAFNELLNKVAATYPVKIIRNSKNLGPAATRNAGWDLAAGDYIAFLDSDDTWLVSKLEVQLAFMKEHPEYLITTHFFDFQKRRRHGLVTFHDLLFSNCISPSCMIVSKALTTRFDESFRYCEDHEFAISSSLVTPIYLLNGEYTLLGRRPHSPGGLSASTWKMRQGQIRIFWKLYKLGTIGFVRACSLSLLALLKHLFKCIYSTTKS